MQLHKFAKVVQKYPQHAEKISDAFNKAMSFPDMSMKEALESFGLKLEEKDIKTLEEEVEFALGEIKKVPY